jgi:DNA-binding cell septation regulator SpoVG
MEVEVQKAFLAREILTTNNETVINNIRLFLEGNNGLVVLPRKTAKKTS